VRKANNDVENGIITTARMLQNGKVKINRACKDAIKEFCLYRWDDKAVEDKPVKENDHAMDDIRYMCQTILRYRLADDDGRKSLL
jgi:phage terminase large subunit